MQLGSTAKILYIIGITIFLVYWPLKAQDLDVGVEEPLQETEVYELDDSDFEDEGEVGEADEEPEGEEDVIAVDDEEAVGDEEVVGVQDEDDFEEDESFLGEGDEIYENDEKIIKSDNDTDPALEEGEVSTAPSREKWDGDGLGVNETGLVEFEYIKYDRKSISQYDLYPYTLRRKTWGFYFSMSQGNYAPVRYVSPNITNYKNTFGSKNGSLEASSTLKLNWFLGSLGLQAGASTFAVSRTIGTTSFSLSIIALRVGLILAFDNITQEPYVVPYAIGGVYDAKVTERVDEVENSIDVAVAPYVGAGLMFGLNWMEPSAAFGGYLENGVENSYVFIEARQMQGNAGVEDLNLGVDIDFRFGIRVEL